MHAANTKDSKGEENKHRRVKRKRKGGDCLAKRVVTKAFSIATRKHQVPSLSLYTENEIYAYQNVKTYV